MDKQAPIVAFLYDFDKTLCTTDMQDYAFIPSLGYDPGGILGERPTHFGRENRMDGLLAYMYTMIRECAAQGIQPLTRAVPGGTAAAVHRSCSPACGTGLPGSTPLARRQGVQVEHYVISSGLREIIEGSAISPCSSRRSMPASFTTMRHGDAVLAQAGR